MVEKKMKKIEWTFYGHQKIFKLRCLQADAHVSKVVVFLQRRKIRRRQAVCYIAVLPPSLAFDQAELQPHGCYCLSLSLSYHTFFDALYLTQAVSQNSLFTATLFICMSFSHYLPRMSHQLYTTIIGYTHSLIFVGSCRPSSNAVGQLVLITSKLMSALLC